MRSLLCFNKLKQTVRLKSKSVFSFRNMANSKFEYVKDHETHETLLQNCWIVIRVDGKGFHKFADKHNFEKPNDLRGLNLMNRCAYNVMNEFFDIVMAYGQSDEYSFIFKKETDVYNRRAHKLISTIASMFASAYVFNWPKYFGETKLLYPPAFDGRSVLYPSDQNLIDYLSWRQADVHINNLYNTTFWNLVLKANMTPAEAEKFLCGTFSSDKNEILFSRFNINYNNEPIMFRKGTTLLRKDVFDPLANKKRNVVVDIHQDMIQDKFWQTHSEILDKKSKSEEPYEPEGGASLSQLVQEQLDRRRNRGTSNDKDSNNKNEK